MQKCHWCAHEVFDEIPQGISNRHVAMGLLPPSDKQLSYDLVKHSKGDNTQTFSLLPLFCVWANYSHMSAIPQTRFIDFTWRNDPSVL